MGLDETALSNGELYTILINKSAKGKKNSIVAIIEGTKSHEILEILYQIPSRKRKQVKEITLDMAPSMNLIAIKCFPNADLVIDRFHVQKLASEAVQEIRIKHRWKAMDQEALEMKQAKERHEKYDPKTFTNGDTTKQLLARSRYILFKPFSKWTEKQTERAEFLFSEFPDIEKAYHLSMGLRAIYEQDIHPDIARVKFANWYEKTRQSGFKSFESIKYSFYQYSDRIVNYFKNRSTNAASESFNAKIKDFRRSYRGVTDLKFFLFRIANIFG